MPVHSPAMHIPTPPFVLPPSSFSPSSLLFPGRPPRPQAALAPECQRPPTPVPRIFTSKLTGGLARCHSLPSSLPPNKHDHRTAERPCRSSPSLFLSLPAFSLASTACASSFATPPPTDSDLFLQSHLLLFSSPLPSFDTSLPLLF